MLITLVVSLALNAGLVCYIVLNKKKKTMSIEAKHLLRDILSGTALIKIDVIDKGDVFLRSPKDL